MTENRKVYFSRFRGADDAEAFCLAARFLKENPFTDLVVEPGEYLITHPLAREAQRHVMNGDWGDNPQQMMFRADYEYFTGIALHGIKNCSVIAQGVKLLIDGFMEPVSVRDCSGLAISGFEITHLRKPFSRGRVTEISGNVCTVELDSDCPVTAGTPVLLRYFFCSSCGGKKILADISSWEFIDCFHILLRAEENFDGISEGMEFYTAHTYHSRPALLLENSENITVDGMIIRNQPGMGVVGNRCENVLISNLRVIPGDGYRFSTNTDATHFTSMKGRLRLENCTAEGQGDDFTNVHAYYQIIVRQTGERTYVIRENTPDGTHSQSIDYPDEGDILELSEIRTLRALGEYRVERAVILPAERSCEVTLDRALPGKTDGLAVADITRLPALEIIGCTCREHYARGVLIKCRSAEITGNSFYGIMGPAVEIAAEAGWYEGVVPANVKVCGNIMENCAANWGEASGIVVKTDCEEPIHSTIHGITIENNRILSPHALHGIYIRNASSVTVCGNTIVCAGEKIVHDECGE